MANIAKGTGIVGNRNYIGRTKWAQAKYDFSLDGGAVGVITPAGNDTIPSGARIVDAFMIVDTIVTSGGAPTVSIGVEGAADLRAAAILGTAPALNAAATVRFALFTPASPPLVTTADRQVTLTVATAALTAGVFRVVVEYIEVAA